MEVLNYTNKSHSAPQIFRVAQFLKRKHVFIFIIAEISYQSQGMTKKDIGMLNAELS